MALFAPIAEIVGKLGPLYVAPWDLKLANCSAADHSVSFHTADDDDTDDAADGGTDDDTDDAADGGIPDGVSDNWDSQCKKWVTATPSLT